MNAASHVLLCALLPRLPVFYRASWAARLTDVEPDLSEVKEAREVLQHSGLIDAAGLTLDGVQAAREALHAWLTPPGSIRPPKGKGGEA